MSMNSSFVYGYGFSCTGIEAEHILKFIFTHKHTVCSLIEQLHKNGGTSGEHGDRLTKLIQKAETAIASSTYPDINDLKEDIGSDPGDVETALYKTIADVMAEETNIRFEYQPGQEDMDSPEAILFVPTYPWYMNDTEKNLSCENELHEIMARYGGELGITYEDIDFMEIEYYG